MLVSSSYDEDPGSGIDLRSCSHRHLANVHDFAWNNTARSLWTSCELGLAQSID